MFLFVYRNKAEKADPDTFTFFGIVRNSGSVIESQPNEKAQLGLKYSQFQITNISGIPNDLNGYFLEDSNTDFANYLNTCVEVSGKIVDGWQNIAMEGFTKNGAYTYSNSAIQDVKIKNTLDLDKCVIMPLVNSAQNQTKEFEGRVKNIKRPAPDIPYDYVLEFDTPKELPNAAGLPTVKNVVIVPTSTNVEKKIQHSANKKISLKGYVSWGYAESTVLYLTE